MPSDEERNFEHVATMIATAIDPTRKLPVGIASTLEGSSTSKLYDDGGLRMRFAGELLKRSFSHHGQRWTPDELIVLCTRYFEDLNVCKMPPTVTGLALYLGWTVNEMDAEIRRDNECSRVLRLAKDSIRCAIEQAAVDGAINPLIYFHQQKAYHGVIERQELIVQPIRLDPDEAEVDQIIDILPE